jgi:DNA invertase Pin-like site-specific DNA recombinase
MSSTAILKQYTPYYHISTQKKGTSRIGLAAQQAAMRAFVPDPAQLLSKSVEVESGKNNHQPRLLAAIVEARRTRSTLLIAKLDQLSRNAGFVFALRDSGVDFVCCDMPDANTLTMGLFAVIAQHGRETISRRTKDALQAKKAREAQLVTPANLTDAARATGRAAMQQNAREHQVNRQAKHLVELLHAQGQLLPQLAAELTATALAAAGVSPDHRQPVVDPAGGVIQSAAGAGGGARTSERTKSKSHFRPGR